MRLTKRSIQALEYDPDGPGQQIHWDDRLQNFGVRVFPTGAKSFVLRYRNEHGRRKYLTVGKFGRMTVQQAQSEALQLFAQVDAGEDPAAKNTGGQIETIEELVDVFIEKHCKVRRKKSWKTDESRLRRHVVAHWREYKVAEVGRADVGDLHRMIGEDIPVEANRVVETLVTMWNFAHREGIVDDGVNPARYVNKFKEESRERWLRPEEVTRMAPKIDALENPYLRHYYWLLLLTATRRTELLTARWEHVSLDDDLPQLYLPGTKNKKDHTVPLSPPAQQILRAIPRQAGNPWVFCGHIKGQRLTDVNHPWMDVRKKVGLDDVVLHDFRRTAASWLAQSGYSALVIKKFINHKDTSVTGIYARLRPEAVRGAVEEYGRQVMAARMGEEGKVVSLVAARGDSNR